MHFVVEEMLGRLDAPHGNCHRCNLRGCQLPVAFDASTGRVHDFCTKDHAERAIQRGEWQRPASRQPIPATKRLPPNEQCQLAGCCRPRFRDGAILHDYCGRSHAIEAKNRGSSAMNVSSGAASASSSS